MIIPYSEIQEILKDSYIDDGDEILVKHSVYNGEREFALVLIEKCIGLLSRSSINDKFIVQYLQGLLSLTQPEIKHYEAYLNAFIPDESVRENALLCPKLSTTDIAVIKELMQTNMAEYTMKGEYQSCCYSAMVASVYKGIHIKKSNMDCQPTEFTALTRLRAVFSWAGERRQSHTLGLD